MLVVALGVTPGTSEPEVLLLLLFARMTMPAMTAAPPRMKKIVSSPYWAVFTPAGRPAGNGRSPAKTGVANRLAARAVAMSAHWMFP